MRKAIYLSIFLWFVRRLLRKTLVPARKLRKATAVGVRKYPCHINVYQLADGTDGTQFVPRFYRVGERLELDGMTSNSVDRYLQAEFGKAWLELGDWSVGIANDDTADGSWTALTDRIPAGKRDAYCRLCSRMISCVDSLLKRAGDA